MLKKPQNKTKSETNTIIMINVLFTKLNDNTQVDTADMFQSKDCDFCLPCALAFNLPSHTVLRVTWLHHPALGSMTFKAKTKCEKIAIVCKITT